MKDKLFKKSFFISFEGGEGSGKSTQAKLLHDWFSNNQIKAKLTREPGGTEAAEAIRSILVTGDKNRLLGTSELLLHLAARYDHTERFIKPAIKDNFIVISDRYSDSTIAYQGFGHNLSYNYVDNLNNLVMGGYAPDLTIYLKIDLQSGLNRAISRSGDTETRYEKMDIDFHKRVLQGFDFLATKHPSRFITIDANRSIETIHNDIVTIVNHRFLA